MRSGATRTVQRLRLRAGSVASARRLLPPLEDAFRTATLLDASPRLTIIRRWNLGRLPADVSPQTLSLMLDARFAAAKWNVAHGGEAGADIAPAVWFRDALEAHEVAARRLVAGRRLDAWFWPIALPSTAAARTPDAQLRALAFSVAALDEAPVALPLWAEMVVAAGGESQLVRALERGEGRRLLQTALGDPSVGWHGRRHDSPPAPPAPVFTPRPAGEAARPALTPSPESGSTEPARWHAPSPGGHGAVSPDPVIGPESSGGASPHTAGTTRTTTPTPTEPPTRSAGQGGTWRSGPAPRPPGATRATRAADSRRPQSAACETLAPDALPETRVSRLLDADRWAVVDRAETAAGGLLFLVPLLHRLEFGSWCRSAGFTDAASRIAVSAGLFARLLTRLDIPPEDPTWTLVSALCDGDARRLFDDPRVGTAASHWLRVGRARLGRQSRMGLATLVRRRAHIAITPTHVDTFFSLANADVRIRRAGLDLDPGWVPWLGRVVSFHYER